MKALLENFKKYLENDQVEEGLLDFFMSEPDKAPKKKRGNLNRYASMKDLNALMNKIKKMIEDEENVEHPSPKTRHYTLKNIQGELSRAVFNKILEGNPK